MLEPPSPVALLAGIGMIVVGLVAALGWWRRTKVAPAFFWLGAVAWLVHVALRLAAGKGDAALAGWLHAHPLVAELYLGALRGLFVTACLWFFAKRSRVATATEPEAIAYGIGFGAVEAVLLGAYSVFGIVLALTSWNEMTPASRFQASQLTGAAHLALPAFERAVTLVLSVSEALLVAGAVRHARRAWLGLALLAATSTAALTAWAADHFGMRTDAGYVKTELVVAAAVAFWAAVTASSVRRARRP